MKSTLKKIKMTRSDMDAQNLVTEILTGVFAGTGDDRLEIKQIDIGYRETGESGEYVEAVGIFSKSGMVAQFMLSFERERTIFDIITDAPWWKGGRRLMVGLSQSITPDKCYEVSIGKSGPDFSNHCLWLKAVIKQDAERRGQSRP